MTSFRAYPGRGKLLTLLLMGLFLLPLGASSFGDDEIPPPPAVAPTPWPTSTPAPEPSPTPPYPGIERDVFFVNPDAGVTLAGTLVLPEGKGPFPAAIYACGGGPGARDHFMFLFAETLARRGIAILIFDKRGVGKSTGDFNSSHTPDFKQDAIAGFRFLKSQPEINPDKVGMIGHSEGGMIAEMGAAENPDMAFIVLMAAPGVREDQRRALQGVQESKAYVVDAKVLKAVQEILGEGLSRLEREQDPESARKLIHEILTKGYAELNEKEKAQLREVLEVDNATIENKAASPLFRKFLLWDPIPYLKKIRCPVLALNGDKDIAVVYPQNLNAIGEALKEAGNRDYTLKMFRGINHIFLHCTTGTPDENLFYQPCFAPEVLQAMGDWLVKHTK